ncbi:restriction endonuclease subunit S [Bradyrhizobium sp. BRP20]|uniref:restriction endonuclease subunit S n=1 Tax=Bradyrhizobium sp. BRP20 TaxID=2793822 RepID=UPI001CD48B9F|nr:restriction endonuclease subunit S [Bradyrhizobium sp. BRP20]MCA1438055.1 restriction endonuclease subunit S [Bradyrhizobium sp. BRP20]
MSIDPYEKYADSGVPWLGAIPSHWQVVKSRRLFSERKERSRLSDEQLTASQKYGVIYQKDFMALENQRVMQVIHGTEILKHVEPDDFVISMRSFQGGIEWCGLRGSTSSAYVVLVPSEGIVPAFFRYLFKSSVYIQALQSTTNLVRDGQALRFENFAHVDLPVLPRVEQQTIAEFLDRETAKIDALVEEQGRLIELLREKKQAALSHAVTKGLDPQATMKNANIEWLGEVPAHWRLVRIKDVCREIVDCKNRTPEKIPEGSYFVIRTSCVRDGKFDEAGGYCTDAENFEEWTRKGRPQVGDVLFTREAPAGEACLVPSGYDLCLGQRMMYLRPDPEVISPDYLLANIYGPLVRYQIEAKSKGSTVGHLRVGEVGDLPCLLPPLNEQYAICETLRALGLEFDSLLSAAQVGTELLQERRSALIASAVTGKINVQRLLDRDQSHRKAVAA